MRRGSFYSQKRNVGEILKERGENVTLSKPIFEKGVRHVTSAREDDRAGKPDFEAVHIKSVDLKSPAEEEIVEYREKGGSGEAVVREHVGHHADLVVHRGIGPQEYAKLFGDGSITPPVLERVEEKLVAACKIK